jgi:acyl-coenzyme A synthetase/AMP-(fatty) acid ligase/aryl carrier-like protein
LESEAREGLDQSVAAQIARHQVTHLQCTPSMARMWSLQDDTRKALASVEHVFIGGEAFPVALAKDLRSVSISGNVTNMYGPTETTIWSTTWKLDGDLDVIPVGTPIANTQIYVLDANRQPVPPGVAGELWIGGLGVVRGYHERPELTAERFVADPFRPGNRMYCTGDLARWRALPDGSAHVEFLGRIDHQVKIRGYRIELGEIEAQLGRFSGVRECVAVVREDTPGDQQLVAYLSPASGADLDPAAVKDHLRATLPEVMVPSHVTMLDDLPHTPNGKIDRNALPSLSEVLGRRSAAAPPVEASTQLEHEVLDVWREVLGTERIGVDDNFFDLGGHSLLMVRLHRRLKEQLGRPITLTDLYRHPTVRSFAESPSVDTAAATAQSSRDRAPRRRDSLQRRRARR